MVRDVRITISVIQGTWRRSPNDEAGVVSGPYAPHIERAFAAEAAGRLREAHHQGRELRISQPMRHGLAQHAALVLLVEALSRGLIHALAGDHQHVLEPLRLRGLEEAAELRVRVALAHAMQVEPRLDLELALVELTRGLPVERRGARHMSGFRRGLRRGLRRPRELAAASPSLAGAAILAGFGAGASRPRFNGDAVPATFSHSASSSSSPCPRFPMTHTPGAALGRSTKNCAGAKVLPAIAPASSPEPQ